MCRRLVGVVLVFGFLSPSSVTAQCVPEFSMILKHEGAGCPSAGLWDADTLAVGVDGTLCHTVEGGDPGVWSVVNAVEASGPTRLGKYEPKTFVPVWDPFTGSESRPPFGSGPFPTSPTSLGEFSVVVPTSQVAAGTRLRIVMELESNYIAVAPSEVMLRLTDGSGWQGFWTTGDLSLVGSNRTYLVAVDVVLHGSPGSLFARAVGLAGIQDGGVPPFAALQELNPSNGLRVEVVGVGGQGHVTVQFLDVTVY